MNNDQGGEPLSHLRVLDLTSFLSGPHCTQILGDLGAEVIKVERPEGDMTRTLPPHFVGGDSAYFLSTNRNKKSIVVDLKNPEGRELIIELAHKCDVLIENSRPGVVERLGLDYDEISDHHPGLVWCSISGFGQNGPSRDLPAYDMVIQAISGVMSLTGEKGRAPVRTGVPLSDLVGGMYAAIAILAALQERDVSGRGQQIDISLLDSMISMLSYQGVYYLVSGDVPDRQGRGHDSIPTYRTFTASDDGDVTVTANTEKMFQSLCEVTGIAEVIDDPRFATLEARHKHREQLWELLDAKFRTRKAADWVDLLRAAGIPTATVNTVDHALNDPQVRHRNMVVTLRGSTDRSIQVLGNPMKFSRSSSAPDLYPPALGDDTVQVLRDLLDYTEADIRQMAEAGVIAVRA